MYLEWNEREVDNSLAIYKSRDVICLGISRLVLSHRRNREILTCGLIFEDFVKFQSYKRLSSALEYNDHFVWASSCAEHFIS